LEGRRDCERAHFHLSEHHANVVTNWPNYWKAFICSDNTRKI